MHNAHMLTKIPQNPAPEFFTRERCHIKEILNDPRHNGLSIARCRVEPGVTTELHRLLGTAETYLIEQGTGRMDDAQNAPLPVGPGDCIAIPPGHAQRITNTGDQDLLFLVICTPRFTPECYEPKTP